MIYLFLCILVNAGLILAFRIFPGMGIKSFQAIMANYFTAGSLGFFLSNKHPFQTETPHQAWFPYVITLGILFISLFYLIALTTQKSGVSVATVSNKMSVVIPVISAIFLYDESLSVWQWVGLFGALSAVVMVSIKKDIANAFSNRGITRFLPLVLFIGCGFLDTLIGFLQFRFAGESLPSAFLLSSGFLIAGLFGLGVFIGRIIGKKDTIHLKSIIAGLLLGVPNFFSMFLMMKTLESGMMNASVFFPVNNIGVVGTATLFSVIFFRERLSGLNIAGVLLSLLSIALIAFF